MRRREGCARPLLLQGLGAAAESGAALCHVLRVGLSLARLGGVPGMEGCCFVSPPGRCRFALSTSDKASVENRAGDGANGGAFALTPGCQSQTVAKLVRAAPRERYGLRRAREKEQQPLVLLAPQPVATEGEGTNCAKCMV